MPGFDVLVRSSGPIPDKQTRRIVTKQLRTMKDHLGEEIVRRVQVKTKIFKHPTGYYKSQIDYTVNQGNGAVVVHDRGVVYGPWLEGTGRRNAHSRFKGYALFRKTMQEIQAEVDTLALEDVNVMVRQLSGR